MLGRRNSRILTETKSFSAPLLFIFICVYLALLSACSDQEAERRISFCKNLGVTEASALEACEKSRETQMQIIGPMLEARRKREILSYNEKIKEFEALSTRDVDKKQYRRTSIRELNVTYDCCFLTFGDIRELEKHALYGKRFAVEGEINFWPRDPESGESFSVDLKDVDDPNNTWRIDVDIESLNREQRRFIRQNCNAYLGHCKGLIYGVIGLLEKDLGGASGDLGMQIEYIDLLAHSLDK